ncbi:MAG: hypothetical protein QGH30_04440 [Candidatus Krumholzibacteria bacterium]|jgi:hypothetical protein|nr:hypothetical protein [Candidatus Krumholzibacteria bacterium]
MIFLKICGGMAARQIARDLEVAPSTVDRHIERLGRHCLLFHRNLMQDYQLQGDLVIDGFETFELSQYFPFHHNLAVEAETGFFLSFTDSELRRKGRMREDQKSRRGELEAQWGRPDPKAVEKGVRELLEDVLAGESRVVIRSDDHRAYPRAMWGISCSIEHQVTSSKDYRDRHNALWEINLLDLLLRHSNANHRRETLAWSKRRQNSSLRLAILLVWRNYLKKRWEKGKRETPAMLKGLCKRPLKREEILTERLFPKRQKLSPRWEHYYRGSIHTRALGKNREHTLSYAY